MDGVTIETLLKPENPGASQRKRVLRGITSPGGAADPCSTSFFSLSLCFAERGRVGMVELRPLF